MSIEIQRRYSNLVLNNPKESLICMLDATAAVEPKCSRTKQKTEIRYSADMTLCYLLLTGKHFMISKEPNIYPNDNQMILTVS